MDIANSLLTGRMYGPVSKGLASAPDIRSSDSLSRVIGSKYDILNMADRILIGVDRVLVTINGIIFTALADSHVMATSVRKRLHKGSKLARLFRLQ
jgi:hypothetical protein